MDPRTNPYAPGAGTPPPELSGRDELIEQASIALDRIRAGRPARSFVFYGLRGVGKTVLLNRIRIEAESQGFLAPALEAPEDRSLPGLLAPPLRATLLKLKRGAAAADKAKRAWQALSGFIGAMRLSYNDVEVHVDATALHGVADSGDLEADLAELLVTVGEAAREAGTAVALFVDELQYVPEAQLAALVMALHRVSQRSLPVALVGAGLPQLLGQMGRAKSYAERMFRFVEVGSLDRDAATGALVVPARSQGIGYEQAAVDEVLRATAGYPYFLQEWGKHCWDVANASPITHADAVAAGELALAELDASFFRVRFDRLTPAEKDYVRAMAALGPGSHRSGDIAAQLEFKVSTAAPRRAALIRKGMVYGPAHGDTAFTVPLFDAFVRRMLPD